MSASSCLSPASSFQSINMPVIPLRRGSASTTTTRGGADEKSSFTPYKREGRSPSLPRRGDTGRDPVPFIEEDSFTDLVLIVEGKRLYTSKTLLSMSSPVFARMLTSQEYKDKKEVPLQGMQFDTAHELLYVLHPAYQRKITDQSAFSILAIAEEYQIWNLKQRCEETLLNSLNAEKTAKEDILIRCLHASDEYKLFALWTKCLQLCAKPTLNLSSLQRCSEYENLSKFLKSMLEAFKDKSSAITGSPNETGSSITTRRGSTTTLIDETNMKRNFSTAHTQTRY
ncbi:hypothetical protein FSP39_002609 [Pinctada imbricata]|uniref:BTB domain-containing protein n=1 Tax=Pinctada imbricata TaxID=66713 RepID=A0AA89C7S6_PINIB|nr:hypothetical protein FSP39_002609 [Pinctada imbricata]